ncbi:helix-turn-helix domain-containing protein [Actinomadura sp. NPDC023710]|uniref:helix-turn-helix domain-containing protein n=1 Tax=Actinomadura sp. NPDC023710 TaxID=3158219 RepID=UPI0033F6027A
MSPSTAASSAVPPLCTSSEYRLCPTAGRRQAPARAFGCARTVFNDGLRARQNAHAAGRRTSAEACRPPAPRRPARRPPKSAGLFCAPVRSPAGRGGR